MPIEAGRPAPMTLIVRLKGGLGNQLFSYAASRRLALANNVELAIDDVSGFARDHVYRRQYALGKFAIPVRKATPFERMEPLGRYRRSLAKRLARRKPFELRSYIEQEGDDFDVRLLNLRLRDRLVQIEGHWQSEQYFKDIENVIRADLRLAPPDGEMNSAMAKQIASCCAVALHMRWFESPNGQSQSPNVAGGYYQRAMALIRAQLPDAHFFIFSDNPSAAAAQHGLPEKFVTLVDHNKGRPGALRIWG